jgi:hypothetical protein
VYVVFSYFKRESDVICIIHTYPSIYEFWLQRPCKFIAIFQFTNIVFATTKNQPSSASRACAEECSSTQHVENARLTLANTTFTFLIKTLIPTLIIEENYINFLLIPYVYYTYSVIKVLIKTVVYSLFT